MTKNFIFIKILFFFIILSGLTDSGSLQAQEKNISGVVTDAADGSTLIGVTVRAKGNTTIGTTTHVQVKYQLSVPDSIQSLFFSYVGYKTKTVDITGTSLQVKLTSGQQLNELVVVGYGTRKAKDVSSAITKLSDDHFNKGVVTNPI